MNTRDTSQHPCFNKGASGQCGRVHLPIAPKCNIQCNYCNRKYDCVNESRPGVTSAVLAPAQAMKYMEEVLEREPRISVAGIAGPGDPMANPAETLGTLRLLKQRFPHLLFCLSSNGLAMPQHLDELAELGVSHVTVTCNAVDTAIGKEIYSFVRDGNVIYRGEQAAKLLLERQLEAIEGAVARGMMVKVNSIIIPGVNEHHLEEVARTAGKLGATLHNLIPLHPTAGTPYADLTEPTKERVRELRAISGAHVAQMTHCRRCRADAVGMLCKDRSKELAPVLESCASLPPAPPAERPYVAVATREGMLVNQHLGEAKTMQIWEQTDNGFRMVEERPTARPGCGPKRWNELATTLCDCRAVLAAAMGDSPREILEKNGIATHACTGFIQEMLPLAYSGDSLDRFKGRAKGMAGACSGKGTGCGPQ